MTSDRVALFDEAAWRTMLDEALQETGGPLTEEEREWADRVLETPTASESIRNSG